MEKIRISAVSYLNTLPFIYGMEQDKEFLDTISLSKDIPATCAQKLLNDEVDVGLVPVAVIPELEKAHIITDYCIGAVGEVRSVLLVSEVPLAEIESIFLDYQSRTSVKLCQLLCNGFWNIQPKFIPAEVGYEESIGERRAGIIIGDRTFHLPKKFKYVYDLSEEWMKWQNLPFVFAAWVSNKKLEETFINQFDRTLHQGVTHIDQAILKYNLKLISAEKQLHYLNNYISYRLDEKKRQGLNQFLKLISRLKKL